MDHGSYSLACPGLPIACTGQPISFGRTKGQAVANWNRRAPFGWRQVIIWEVISYDGDEATVEEVFDSEKACRRYIETNPRMVERCDKVEILRLETSVVEKVTFEKKGGSK
ncbi:MAG TPA: hypothetical protein VK961_06850 [Chthoniobacter sp.]|nr:hypothetical protein [Chthoniobacter sp.]